MQEYRWISKTLPWVKEDIKEYVIDPIHKNHVWFLAYVSKIGKISADTK